MNVGVFMFATDYAIRIDELARECEARGFESLFVPEHTHIPASRKTPFPAGTPLPEEYWHTHDPFVSLMAAAAATKKLKVGTGICLLIERDTIVTAKEVASLDALSDGRFLFGIGAGWNREEMEDHGTEFKTRFSKLREQVLAMKEIWTKDDAEFHGKHVSFDPMWSWPKPAQKPHPPIYLGGHGPKALQRVVRYCDGWMPIPIRAGDLAGEIKDLRGRAAAAGRDPDAIAVTMYGVPADAERVRSFSAAGAHRAIFGLPSAGRETVLPLLDRYAAVAAELRGS
jgi:probable F420-dependent oxidoreductase